MYNFVSCHIILLYLTTREIATILRKTLSPIQPIKATIVNLTKQNTGQALNMGLWNRSLKYMKVSTLLGDVDTVMSEFAIALVKAKGVSVALLLSDSAAQTDGRHSGYCCLSQPSKDSCIFAASCLRHCSHKLHPAEEADMRNILLGLASRSSMGFLTF